MAVTALVLRVIKAAGNFYITLAMFALVFFSIALFIEVVI